MEMDSKSSSSSLHIAMYPWFAFGHLTPYLHFANKLAEKGHTISFLVPTKTQSKIQHFNQFPDLITFVPITVPHVEGLPPGAETTADVANPQIPLVMTAMDLTRPKIETLLRCLEPQVILFDFAFWIPQISRPLGVKTVHYSVVSAVTMAYNSSPARYLNGREFSEEDLMNPPPGFPDSSIKIRRHEARDFLKRRCMKFGGDMLFYDRVFRSLSDSDALAIKGCREMEGPFLEFLERDFRKPLLISGPVIPVKESSQEQRWTEWLDTFEPGSVIYCGFGSEVTLSKHEFVEIVSGLEISGLPFIAALRLPIGCESAEEAFPEGFEERVARRGRVHFGWIQQQVILGHPSVGCYFSHCGSGSILEALVHGCDLVLMPFLGDQIFNARLIGNMIKAGIEVERCDEDGSFTRERVCEAIKIVMDEDYGGDIGREVRENRAKLTQILLREDLELSYVDEFSQRLYKFVTSG